MKLRGKSECSIKNLNGESNVNDLSNRILQIEHRNRKVYFILVGYLIILQIKVFNYQLSLFFYVPYCIFCTHLAIIAFPIHFLSYYKAITLREDIFARRYFRGRYFRGRYFREFRANSRKYLPRNSQLKDPRFAKISSAKISSAKISSAKISSAKISSAKISSAKISSLKVYLYLCLCLCLYVHACTHARIFVS